MTTASTTDDALRQVKFANSNVANLVIAPEDAPAEALLESLEVKSCDFILLPLGASSEGPSAADAALEPLAGPLLQVLAELGRSVVLGTGTRSWLTAPLHQRKATKPEQVAFVGVAPEALVAYPGKPDPAAPTERARQLDSWYSAVVLVAPAGQWGAQLPMMHAVVQALASRSAQVPALALLAGGGPAAVAETLAAVRQGIPLAVVQGSGGLADDIAAVLAAGRAAPVPDLLAEIITEGQITVVSQPNFLADFARLGAQLLAPDEVLTQAWENFAAYEQGAQHQQRRSDGMVLSIVALGVLGTVLAISKQLVYPRPFRMTFSNFHQYNFGLWLLHASLLLIPIVLTVLVAAAYKFKMGAKWFVLRAGAEALKSEIYGYRARALGYQNNAAPQLAARMAEIRKRTMQSEANASYLADYDKAKGFPPYMDGAGGGDSGFGFLAPERYVEVRLDDQLRYFRKRTRSLDRQFQWLYWLTLLIGGAGTLLAAIRQEVWIAVTASLTAAVGALLNYRQIETNLLKFNMATADLDNIKSWWKALSAADKARQSNIDALVDRTEKVLQTELDGWVQQMKNALADLEKTQSSTAQQAQQWRPALRFTPSNNDEEQRAHVKAAAETRVVRTATVVRTDDTEVVVATSTLAPAPAEPAPLLLVDEPVAPTRPEAAPAALPEVTVHVNGLAPSPKPAPASPAPAAASLVAALVSPSPVPASPVPAHAKAHWEPAEVTPAVLRRTLKRKNYLWFESELNIIGIRATKYVDNTFSDRIFCCWKQPHCPPDSTLLEQQQFLAKWLYKGQDGKPIVADNKPGANTTHALAQLAKDAGQDRVMSWPVTTRPGTYWLTHPMHQEGCSVVAPHQHLDAYQLGTHRKNKPGEQYALVQRGYLTYFLDNNRNATAEERGKILRGNAMGINIHHSSDMDAGSVLVDKWSAGCQVFKRKADHAELLHLCELAHQKDFTYTLLHEADLT